MARAVRDIVHIDEELCDGCGDCVPSCAEGAIRIIDGKARLVAENLCDGFGNCLGVCPRGAIRIEKRAADDYDESAVDGHLTGTGGESHAPQPPAIPSSPKRPLPLAATTPIHSGGCPGSALRMFASPAVESENQDTAETVSSTLSQWPVQLMLVPPTAPFLKGREILLAADCCPFAFGDFHRRFLKGKALLIGCPKLDDLAHYRQKLEACFRQSGCSGVTVMIMEVPCCGGLKAAAVEAYRAAGADFPLKEVVIGIRGEVLSESLLS